MLKKIPGKSTAYVFAKIAGNYEISFHLDMFSRDGGGHGFCHLSLATFSSQAIDLLTKDPGIILNEVPDYHFEGRVTRYSNGLIVHYSDGRQEIFTPLSREHIDEGKLTNLIRDLQ